MYDTTIMELHKGDAAGINFISDITPKLSNIKEGKINGKYFTEGYLSGILKVRCTESFLKIPNGNMRAYFFNNPFYDFDRSTFEKAIEKLEDELQAPMKKAKMKRIDCGITISLKYSPELYFRYYGNIPGYKRLDLDNGVIWKGKKDRYTIYWKQVHLRETNKPIPKEKDDGNHVRVELRVSKQLGNYFHHLDIRADDLYKEDFYINAYEKWYQAYEKIIKAGRELDSISIPEKKTELLETLACFGVSFLHPSEVENKIKEAYKMEKITSKQAHDLRKTVRKLQEKGRKECPSELVEEFNRKIKNRVKYYR